VRRRWAEDPKAGRYLAWFADGVAGEHETRRLATAALKGAAEGGS
jgi:hypothetical protein